MHVTNKFGISFNIRIVKEGDYYGLNNSLLAEVDMIEFYDSRFPHTPHGRFISRYYIHQFIKLSGERGLCLDGGVKHWVLSSENIRDIQFNLLKG